MTEFNDWAASKGQMSDEEPATPDEVEVMREFLQGIVATSTAAKNLMTMKEDKVLLEKFDKTNRVSYLIFDAAMDFPNQQCRLLDLLDAIRELSDAELDFTTDQKDRFPGWQDWKRLDRFDDLLDEERRSYWASRFTPNEDDQTPLDCIHRYANVNALCARLWIRQRIDERVPFDISVLQPALEQEPWKQGVPANCSQYSRKEHDITILDCEIPAAAQLLMIAAKNLYQTLVAEGLSHEVTSDLWKGKTGLSKERWDFWKARLQWIQKQAELKIETHDMSKLAFDAMKAAEADTE